MRFLLLLFALPLLAAEADDWSNLQRLHAGDKVGIVGMNMKRTEGRFVSFTADSITLDSGSRAAAEVARVYRRHGLKRGYRALIGAGVGVVAGIVFNETGGRYFENEVGYSNEQRAGAVAAGAGIGAAVGALTGSGYETVYQRR